MDGGGKSPCRMWFEYFLILMNNSSSAELQIVCYSCCRKADNELADVTQSGSLLKNCAAATRHARPPMVDSLNSGIHKRFDTAETEARIKRFSL